MSCTIQHTNFRYHSKNTQVFVEFLEKKYVISAPSGRAWPSPVRWTARGQNGPQEPISIRYICMYVCMYTIHKSFCFFFQFTSILRSIQYASSVYMYCLIIKVNFSFEFKVKTFQGIWKIQMVSYCHIANSWLMSPWFVLYTWMITFVEKCVLGLGIYTMHVTCVTYGMCPNTRA